MAENIQHIIFSMSAGGSLVAALKLAGKSDGVLKYPDDLSYGPIADARPDTCLQFVEDILGYAWDDDLSDLTRSFWQQALDTSHNRIVWLSRRSAMEYCGFLKWLTRNGQASFLLVDLTDVKIPDPNAPATLLPVGCTARVPAAQIAKNALWSLAKVPDPADLASWIALWSQLRAENAPLRIITDDGLVSAPLDHFDADLLSHIGSEWTRANRVVGETMAALHAQQLGGAQCNDLVLFARLRNLVEQGALDSRGDIYGPQLQVRRALRPNPDHAGR